MAAQAGTTQESNRFLVKTLLVKQQPDDSRMVTAKFVLNTKKPFTADKKTQTKAVDDVPGQIQQLCGTSVPLWPGRY
jgi:hypothetical protein